MPTGLFIVPTHLEALRAKGVLDMVREREASGYLSAVTLHPRAPKTGCVTFSPRQVVYEVGMDACPKWIPYPIRRVIERVLYPARLAKLVGAILSRHHIDFIRGQDPYWMGTIAWIVSRVSKIPFSVSIHADYDQRFDLDGPRGAPVILGSRGIAKWLETLVLRNAALVLPIRETLAKKAVRAGACPCSVRVIPHGFDFSEDHSDVFDLPRAFEIDPSKKIISYAARLTKENYVDDVLDAACLLYDRRDDFVVVLAGGGREEERVRRRIRADVRLRNVRLVGFQPKDVVLELRRQSAVSICLMGGFSLLEALAVGSPVVSYDTEWHAELVRNDETGFLVAEHDVPAVVERLDYLLSHPGEANRMGRKGRDLTRSRHSLCRTRRVKIRVYDELVRLGKRPGHASATTHTHTETA